jgi:hypothetical protein
VNTRKAFKICPKDAFPFPHYSITPSPQSIVSEANEVLIGSRPLGLSPLLDHCCIFLSHQRSFPLVFLTITQLKKKCKHLGDIEVALNSKHEARNPKQIQNSNVQNPKQKQHDTMLSVFFVLVI